MGETGTRSAGRWLASQVSPPCIAISSTSTTCHTTPSRCRSWTCNSAWLGWTSTAIRSTSCWRRKIEESAMATKLKPTDVVVVGVGVTGAILAKELAEAGLKVVGIERGQTRDTYPDFQLPNAHDELKYQRRHELMQDLSRETITFRNNKDETALPMRYLGSFKPGEGVGGAGVHWGTQPWRSPPGDSEPPTRPAAP